MTKIVYNTNYGGFGLSDAAIMRYAEIKGITLYPSTSGSGFTTTISANQKSMSVYSLKKG